MKTACSLDVLCVGNAAWDMIFTVPQHPGPDDKCFAERFFACGGGPAANAAVTAARLGCRAGFAGYLGNDCYGDIHCAELQRHGVSVDFLVRGAAPTPLSLILVKPDGSRTIVSYHKGTEKIPAAAFDAAACTARVMLFDGHEPHLAQACIGACREQGILTVLDAGSVHDGTRLLAPQVDYLVASEKFSLDFTGDADPVIAARRLHQYAPHVVITRGRHGLVWHHGTGSGVLPAYPVRAVDTTGAGDCFHGAFAAGLAKAMGWHDLLRYASAAAAVCCTGYGGRGAVLTDAAVREFLAACGSSSATV
jgi:sulfofructose kinase